MGLHEERASVLVFVVVAEAAEGRSASSSAAAPGGGSLRRQQRVSADGRRLVPVISLIQAVANALVDQLHRKEDCVYVDLV